MVIAGKTYDNEVENVLIVTTELVPGAYCKLKELAAKTYCPEQIVPMQDGAAHDIRMLTKVSRAAV